MYLTCIQKNCSLLTISHRNNILSLTQKNRKCVAFFKKIVLCSKYDIIPCGILWSQLV